MLKVVINCVAIIVGIISAVIGSYLMVQRLALLGDAISHSVLPGLAIAFCVGANIFIGNLDPEVDEKLLYDTFSAFGVILTTPKVSIIYSNVSMPHYFITIHSM